MRVLIFAYTLIESSDVHFFLKKAFETFGHVAKIISLDEDLPQWDGKGLESHFLGELNEPLYQEVDKFQPDCVFLTESNWVFLPETIRRIQSQGCKVILWEANQNFRAGFRVNAIPLFDHIFTNDSYTIPVLSQFFLAKDVHYLAGGCDPKYHKPINLSPRDRERFAADIALIGSGSRNRVHLLETLSNYELKIWGYPETWVREGASSRLKRHLCDEPVYGLKKTKIYNAAKINLNIQKTITQINGVSCRVFEIAACGGFVLSEYRKDLEQNFEIGREIAVFDGKEDLHRKVEYYLHHEDMRKAIAEQGRARALSEHTYEKKVERLLDIIGPTHKSRWKAVGCRSQRDPLRITDPNEKFSRPKVSVVIPCYRHAKYLPEAVESVINQSYQDFEILIVNDGSPDETTEVAERLISKYPNHRIRLLVQTNQGLATARNNAIREALGQYILPLDADDKIKPTFLEKTVQLLDENEDLGFAYTIHTEFGDRGNTASTAEYDVRELSQHNIPPYASLYRKKVWEDVGGYHSNLKWGYEDWDFWIGAGAKGWYGRLIAEPLFLYRIHGYTMREEAFEHDLELKAKIAKNYPELYTEETLEWAELYQQYLTDPKRFDLNFKLASFFIKKNDWKPALSHLMKCLELNPTSADAISLVGVAYLKSGNFKEAADYLEKAARIKSDDYEVRFCLGLSHLLSDKAQDAWTHFEAASRLRPDQSTPYLFLSGLQWLSGELAAARAILDQAAKFTLDSTAVDEFRGLLSDTQPSVQNVSDHLLSLVNQHVGHAPESILEPKPHIRQAKQPRDTVVVSVILPTRNRPQNLKEALLSVLNQTYRRFEVIVINDGGIDVEDLISSLNREGHIVYAKHGRSLGPAAARNTGLKLARGKYVTYLDDDDLYYPYHLETLVTFLERTGHKVAYSDANEAHQIIEEGAYKTVSKNVTYSYNFDPDKLSLGNFIPILAIMHSRDCLEKTGLFDETLRVGEDLDLWIRLSRQYEFHHIKKVTCEYRMRNHTTTYTKAEELKSLLCLYQRYRHYANPSVLEEQRKKCKEYEARLRKLEEKPAKPLCSVIVSVSDDLEQTRACLNSVMANTPEDLYELIIVDSVSNQLTKPFINGLSAEANVVTNQAPCGSLSDYNRGAEVASADHLVFLHQDALPKLGWLQKLCELAQEDTNIGAVGGKIVHHDSSLQEAGRIVLSDGTVIKYGEGDYAGRHRYRFLREVDVCSSNGLLVRRDLFNQIGGFDTSYDVDYASADLCFAIRKRGYSVVYQPQSIIVSSKRTPLEAKRSDSQQRFARTWCDALKTQPAPGDLDLETASQRGKRVLVIYPNLPTYDVDGSSLRLFNLLKILRRLRYYVTFIALAGNDQTVYEKALESLGIEVHSSDPDKCQRVGIEVRGPRIDFPALLKKRRFEWAILSPWYIAEHYMDEIRTYSPKTKIVLDTSFVHYVRECRRAELEGRSPRSEQSLHTKARELQMCKRSDLVLTASEPDKEALLKEEPKLNVGVIPLIYDFVPVTNSFSDRYHLLFVGSFDNPANVDAVLYFSREVFPLIRQRIPTIQFYIVGHNPPEEIKALAGPAIVVMGHVPDSHLWANVMGTCRVSVAPLRYGAGMKTKICEAMAWGVPIVTTSIGAEGMGLTHGEQVLIADTKDSFAEAVVRLHTDEALWNKLVINGKRHVKHYFGSDAVAKKLKRIAESLAEEEVSGPAIEELLALAREQKKGKAFDAAIETLEKANASTRENGITQKNGYIKEIIETARLKKREGRFQETIIDLERAKALIERRSQPTQSPDHRTA